MEHVNPFPGNRVRRSYLVKPVQSIKIWPGLGIVVSSYYDPFTGEPLARIVDYLD